MANGFIDIKLILDLPFELIALIVFLLLLTLNSLFFVNER